MRRERDEESSVGREDAAMFDPSPPVSAEPAEAMAPRRDAPAPEPPPAPTPERLGEADGLGAAGRRPTADATPRPGACSTAEEVIAMLATLDGGGLDEIERLEREGQAREAVLEAIAGARA